jgi:hypothetical protein
MHRARLAAALLRRGAGGPLAGGPGSSSRDAVLAAPAAAAAAARFCSSGSEAPDAWRAAPQYDRAGGGRGGPPARVTDEWTAKLLSLSSQRKCAPAARAPGCMTRIAAAVRRQHGVLRSAVRCKTGMPWRCPKSPRSALRCAALRRVNAGRTWRARCWRRCRCPARRVARQLRARGGAKPHAAFVNTGAADTRTSHAHCPRAPTAHSRRPRRYTTPPSWWPCMAAACRRAARRLHARARRPQLVHALPPTRRDAALTHAHALARAVFPRRTCSTFWTR